MSGFTLPFAEWHTNYALGSLAHIYGVPGAPEWGDWFAEELKTHHAMSHTLGIGCDPVMVKGTKEQFLDWLSWGVESQAIRFPAAAGSIRWPSVDLEDMFLQVR